MLLRRAVTTLAAAFVAVLVVAVPASSAGTSALAFSPRVVTVGQVPVGTTSEAAVTLTNSGSEALTLNSFEAFGDNGNFMAARLGRHLRPARAAPSAF